MISQTGVIEYRIERSSRRTVVITVRPGEVIVRAPYGVSEETLRRFVESKHDWIVHKLVAYGVTAQRFGQVRSMCALLDEGAEKPVCFGAEKSFERDGVFYFQQRCGVILSEHAVGCSRKECMPFLSKRGYGRRMSGYVILRRAGEAVTQRA